MKTLLPPFKNIILYFSAVKIETVGFFKTSVNFYNRTSSDIETGNGNGEISNGLCLGRVSHCCAEANKYKKIAGQTQKF
jgi:hypothetical protein